MYALEPAPEQAVTLRRFLIATAVTTLMFCVAQVSANALSKRPRLPRAPRVEMTIVQLVAPAPELAEVDPGETPVEPPTNRVNQPDRPAPTVHVPAKAESERSPSEDALAAEPTTQATSLPAVFIAGLTLSGGTQVTGVNGVAGGTGGQAARRESFKAGKPASAARRNNESVQRRGSEPEVDATLLKSVTPEYSLEATRGGIEGLVVLVITIDSQGRVRDARVIQGLGFGLDEAAVRAAKQTVWQPSLLGGVPVSSQRRFSVRFNLRS